MTGASKKVREIQALEKIPVGVSGCLLGEQVRFDGGHKRDAYIVGTLAKYFAFIPVCPEMAIGMGAPREPIRLVGDPDRPRALGVRTEKLDVTESLRNYGVSMAEQLGHLCGYIFKRASPSCGMERVKVYSEKGMPSNKGVGIYARAFMEKHPLIPCEEEGRLGDPVLRENFIQRVFVMHRWRNMAASRLTRAKLVDFHTRHKYIVMAHNQTAYKRMGQLVSKVGSEPLRPLAERYFAELMSTLKLKATRKRHANVLLHLLGYLKHNLDTADKEEMMDTISVYSHGEIPIIVPITLFKHHFRRYPNPYIEKQYYLTPHPQELMLRNLL